MRHLILMVGLVLTMLVSSSPVWAMKAAVLYNLGGKFDKSFNESAFGGVMRAVEQRLADITEYEPTTEAERITMLQDAAKRADIIVTIGFAYRDVLQTTAQQYPNKRFAIIDDAVPLPNVQSICFKEQEGTFLAGVAAAMASKTKIIGFVGGMDSPLIRRFEAGYIQGAKSIDPNITVLTSMIGPDVSAFSDPMAGYLHARQHLQKGADVIFAAAGGSGLGVYQAADEAVALAIGVDADQTYLFPGTMLTSMVKNIGQAVYDLLLQASQNATFGGTQELGLENDALTLAISTDNQTLMTPNIRQAVSRARSAIMSGQIQITLP